jgi:hypothetical protein
MQPQEIELTPEEREALYFIPQVPGGRVVCEEILLSLESKGLVTPVGEHGPRWLTVLGDRVRRGRA